MAELLKAQIIKNVCVSDEIVPLPSCLLPTVPPADIPLPDTRANTGTGTGITLDETEQIRAEAFQKGFNQGHDEANAAMAEPLRAIKDLLQSLPDAVADHRQQTGGEIADIVLFIAGKFFISQQQNKQAIAGQISSILSQINEEQDIELFLHPQDLALLQQDKPGIDLKPCRNLTVIADDSLRLGGCRVRSRHGLFDAGIERQIDRLKQMLLQIKQGSDHE